MQPTTPQECRAYRTTPPPEINCGRVIERNPALTDNTVHPKRPADLRKQLLAPDPGPKPSAPRLAELRAAVARPQMLAAMPRRAPEVMRALRDPDATDDQP